MNCPYCGKPMREEGISWLCDDPTHKGQEKRLILNYRPKEEERQHGTRSRH